MEEIASQHDLRTRLRELRKARGWTLVQVGEALGTTAQTISRLETNVMTVSTEWLQKFASLYDVAPADLIADDKRAAVQLIGRVAGAGLVAPCDPAALSVYLELENGLAIEVSEAQGPIAAGVVLVAARLKGRNFASANGKTCLVKCVSGAMRLAKVIDGLDGKCTLVPVGNGDVLYDQKLEWAAPIKLELKFEN